MKPGPLTKSYILKCRSVGWGFGFVLLVDGKLNTRQDFMNMLRPSTWRLVAVFVQFVKKHVHPKMLLLHTFQEIIEKLSDF